MASEHFFSWPGNVRALDKRTRVRTGLRMIAAAAVMWAFIWATVAVLGSGLTAASPLVFALLLACVAIVSLMYFLRGFVVLLRGLLAAAAPAPASTPGAMRNDAASLAPPEVPGKIAMASTGKLASFAVWLGGTLVVLGALAAWLSTEAERFSRRARLSDGFMATSPLRLRIMETFEQQGPRDMSCSAARCGLDEMTIHPVKGVQELASDRTGAITIDFNFGFLAQGQRRVTLVPMFGERVIDLSQPAPPGAAIDKITWKCTSAMTTVPQKWLPTSCR